MKKYKTALVLDGFYIFRPSAANKYLSNVIPVVSDLIEFNEIFTCNYCLTSGTCDRNKKMHCENHSVEYCCTYKTYYNILTTSS